MAHVRNQNLDILSAQARIGDQSPDTFDQLGRRLAPPPEIVEAEVQDDEIGLVRRDLGLDQVHVHPRGAAVHGEVGGAAAGVKRGIDGGCIGPPGLGVGEINVVGYRGREGSVVRPDVLQGGRDVRVAAAGEARLGGGGGGGRGGGGQGELRVGLEPLPQAVPPGKIAIGALSDGVAAGEDFDGILGGGNVGRLAAAAAAAAILVLSVGRGNSVGRCNYLSGGGST